MKITLPGLEDFVKEVENATKNMTVDVSICSFSVPFALMDFAQNKSIKIKGLRLSTT
jgi:hypothetical protein